MTNSHQRKNIYREIEMFKGIKLQSTVIEINNFLNSRSKVVEERISKLKDRSIEIIQSGEQKEKEGRKMNRASET